MFTFLIFSYNALLTNLTGLRESNHATRKEQSSSDDVNDTTLTATWPAVRGRQHSTDLRSET